MGNTSWLVRYRKFSLSLSLFLSPSSSLSFLTLVLFLSLIGIWEIHHGRREILPLSLFLHSLFLSRIISISHKSMEMHHRNSYSLCLSLSVCLSICLSLSVSICLSLCSSLFLSHTHTLSLSFSLSRKQTIMNDCNI